MSFALSARDEWYQAAGSALLGGSLATVLCLLLHFPWWAAASSSVLWALGAGAIASALHRARRGADRFDPSSDGTRPVDVSRSLLPQLGVLRVFDIVIAVVGLVIGAPLIAACALIVAAGDGFPILFKQRRKGRDDKDFVLLKFRTMHKSAGSAWARPGDERITRRGAFLRRTSLDELPQLYNVLVGHMSIVGPRPEMSEYAERFAVELPRYSARHAMRPGLTGWAQLHLQRNLDPSDARRVLAYDLFYIEHASVYLYLFCVVKTACEIFGHDAV